MLETEVPLDPQFQTIAPSYLRLDLSIKRFKVYITGDLAAYALLLGKPNSAPAWCTWCDAKKSWFGLKDKLENAVDWTLERIGAAKAVFDRKVARSRAKDPPKNYLGVSSKPLLCVEPKDYIFPVLHVQMGMVNKALSHLLAWIEMHVENLPEGHEETRTNLINAQKASDDAESAYKDVLESKKNLQEELKHAAGREKQDLEQELEEINEELEHLGTRKSTASNDLATAKKRYKEMRSKRGKPESSFAYLLDKALQAVGAKRPAYHGGDLEGNSARRDHSSDCLYSEAISSPKLVFDSNKMHMPCVVCD
jgi:hypothetical protein